MDILVRIAAIIIGYLLGSLPSAYIVTHVATGKDIRELGGGNIGGLNTFRQVGVLPAVIVAIADLGKGAASVLIAYYWLGLTDLTQPWVLLAGLMSVVGHDWMVWLKFSGGRGMGAAIGALAAAMPLYGYWPGIVIFLAIIVFPLVITHNVALSMGIGLLATPFIAWLGAKSGLLVAWSVATGLVIGLKFLPTAVHAWKTSKTKKDFIFDHSSRSEKDKH